MLVQIQHHANLLVVLSSFLHFGRTVNQTCYYLDGSVTGSEHTPCFPDRDFSACCVLESGTDVCLDSGLCYSKGLMYQGPCTDDTFETGNCAHFCPDREFVLPILMKKGGGGFKKQFWAVCKHLQAP